MMMRVAPLETGVCTHWQKKRKKKKELIQTFIRMHTSTHCHSIYSLTLGKQINYVINKFFLMPAASLCAHWSATSPT